MKSPVQVVFLHAPSRWKFYTLSTGVGYGFFIAQMLGRIEVRLRYPMAPTFFVKEPS